MKLCDGSLEIHDPERMLRDYLDPALGYAWPSYDCLVTNGSAELVDGDLLAPTLLGVHLDTTRFQALSTMLPRLAGIASLPQVALQDADDAVVDQVADIFSVLDEEPYRGRGLRGTIVAKVLHRKRPDLVPLYDSVIFEAYTVSAIPRMADRQWVDFMRLLCQSMRADLQAERERFEDLQQLARSRGATLTQLRILDILVWTTARHWA